MSDALANDPVEAPEKWLCECCGEVCDTPLTAPSPFDADDDLQGCPSCKRAETMTQACQFPGCKNVASSGTPGGYGYRYFWACHRHYPAEPLQPTPQPRTDPAGHVGPSDTINAPHGADNGDDNG